MKIIVTGSAGFIGAALSMRLLQSGHEVIGVDNLNAYYDVDLKKDRNARCLAYPKFSFVEGDIVTPCLLEKLFVAERPDVVMHLAAQAGVRYSITAPMEFVNSNIVGFLNVLEASRKINLSHLVYASSSSVYGGSSLLPYSESQMSNHPLSFYAATKKSNEMMGHSYSHLYGIPMTGLRFFTVYGPWGRPDMALFSFTKSILNGEPIKVFNKGHHKRDFTYIDDVVDALMGILGKPANVDLNWKSNDPNAMSSTAPWRIYNVAGGNPVPLLEYIETLEKHLGVKAIFDMQPLQPGDMRETFADISELKNSFSFQANVTIDVGIKNFVDWYKDYYRI